MDVQSFFKKYGIHFVAMAIFIVAGLLYFSPQFDDYGIKQHDIKMHKGMSNEIVQHREIHEEEPLWTNSMFGGMPATQISVKHEGNFVKEISSAFLRLFPIPMGAFLLHLISFYVMALLLRIKPVIAILGAFAFAFASYEIIILQAGHNSKSIAVAFLPMVLGAFIYAYRENWKLGAALSALFMTFELSANHLQVTYYLGFLLFALGIYFLVGALKNKQFKPFIFSTVGLLVGYGIALFINYGNIAMTNDYAKYTTRGGNDITITPNGEESKLNSGGLDKDYITQWSYGKGESFTFISPYVKGSHSGSMGGSNFAELADEISFERGENAAINNVSMYWGDQPIVAGPFYLGVIVIFLAFLAFFFAKDRSIWVIAGISVLALLLSWGKNFMGFTEFFIDYFPGYNKFRTVTIILVLVELCIPLLAVILLQRLYESREELPSKKKLFLVASGVFLVFLVGLKFSGSGFAPADNMAQYDRYKGQIVQSLQRADPRAVKQQIGIDIQDMNQVEGYAESETDIVFAGARKIRQTLYDISTTRSLMFGIGSVVLCGLFFYTSWSSMGITIALGILLLLDLVPVNQNYLGDWTNQDDQMAHWSPKEEKDYPVAAVNGDYAILEAELAANPNLQQAIDAGEQRGVDKANELEYTGMFKRRIVDSYKFGALGFATNYRVFDINDGWSGTRAAYFHKSIGGYHGAKLRNIQNLIDFQISTSNNALLDMLNVKYILQNGEMSPNRTAKGNAWAVKTVKSFESPNDEIRALGKRFKIENAGTGELYVNGKAMNTAEVFGQERMLYWFPGGTDSIDVRLSNSITKGVEVFLVMDRNGATNLMLDEMIARDTLNSFAKLLKITGDEEFNVNTDAVMLKSEAEKLSTDTYTGEATVAMTSYAPNRIEYNAESKGKQLIVFSEIYYPAGWKALVDGKEQDIIKVNYLLRGLELTDGSHTIEFIYEDPKFELAQTLATTGSVVLFLLIGGVLFLGFRNRKQKIEAIEE